MNTATADGTKYRLKIATFDSSFNAMKSLPNFRSNKDHWVCDRNAGSYAKLREFGFQVEDNDAAFFIVSPLSFPELKTTPWRHQRDGFDFISRKPASLLGYDMGTGKSLIAVAAAVASWDNNARRDTCVLIVCPKAVLPVWKHQFATHCKEYPGDHVAILTLNGGSSTTKADDVRKFFLRHRGSNSLQIVVVNYEAYWRGELGEVLLSRKWEMVICDESHKIKAHNSKASKFAEKLSVMSRRRLCLTGTPMPQTPADVFGQMRFLDSSVFGTSHYHFRDRWFRTHPHFKSKIISLKDEDSFNEQLKDFLLRVDSDEVLDLPETIETFVTVGMSPTARRHYREVEQQLCTMIEDNEITVANALGKMLKMRQIVSGFILDENHVPIKIGTEKIEALEELIDEIGEKEPVVVFTNFKYEMSDIQQLASKLGRPFYEISGSVHDYERIGETPNPIIGVQIQSGGAGIDLSMAAYCVYYSLTYSLGDYLQSRKRVHRPGQTRTTRYYHLTCEDTLDQVIYKSLTSKEDVVNGILNELKRKVNR